MIAQGTQSAVTTRMLRFMIAACLLAVVTGGPAVIKSRTEIERIRAELEKFKEDDGLTLKQRTGKNPSGTAWENSGKYQGDILVDDFLIADLTSSYSTKLRNAEIEPDSRWPDKTIIYEFSREFDDAKQRYILNVMNALAEYTCVRFRRRAPQDRTYVKIQGNKEDGCFAHIGYQPDRGDQMLNLYGDILGYGCLDFVTIAHEWLHAFGFYHMHTTHNRDEYVRIHEQNILPDQKYNFEIQNSEQVSNLGLPYEYGSCMHYNQYSHSANGKPTITPTRDYDGKIGQSDHITGFDMLRLARHYDCPGAWSAAAAETARHTIYVMRDDGKIVPKYVDVQHNDR